MNRDITSNILVLSASLFSYSVSLSLYIYIFFYPALIAEPFAFPFLMLTYANPRRLAEQLVKY